MFDTTRRKPDYFLLTAVGILVPIGMVMVYSASFMDALANDLGHLYYTWRQLVGVIIGSIGLLVAQRLDYRFWRKYSVPLLAVTLVLLILVLVLPESMTTVNDTRSWIIIGNFSMQPAEVAKLALIIYFADWLSRRGAKLGNVTYGLIPFAVILGIVCGLVMIGGDLGTTVVLIAISGIIYFTAGANLLHIAGAMTVAAGAFWMMVQIAPYRLARVTVWLEGPFQHYQEGGFQPAHAMLALGNGGIFGVGLGQGRQKFLWLPQAHTDTIFAIIGEEFGLIGTMFIVACFLVIAYRGFRIAGRAPDPFACLLATGLTAWLVFQALINIAVVTNLLPFTGLPLPFLSYGNSSLIMCMIAAGILLNISRHTRDRNPGERAYVAPTSSRTARSLVDLLPLWGRDRRPRVSGTRSRRSTARTGVRRR